MADNERVAVVIASREEKLLQITVTRTLEAATGDVEVIVILDGYEDRLIQEVKNDPQYDPRVRVIRNKEPIGQRASVNLGARSTDAKYFIKCDAHNLFGPGFDEILKADCEYDWTVIPRLYNLDAIKNHYHCHQCGLDIGEQWDQDSAREKTRRFVCVDCHQKALAPLERKEKRLMFRFIAGKDVPVTDKAKAVMDKICVYAKDCVVKPNPNFFTPKTTSGKTTEYMYISSVHDGKPYDELRAWYHPDPKQMKNARRDYLIDDMMVAQGACWFMHRQRFLDLGGLDNKGHGGWGQVGVEVACKAWLSGGRHVVNKKTWFSHQFRGHMGGASYPLKLAHVNKARAHCRYLWAEGNWDQQVRPLSWLVRKFSPVPTWTEEDVRWLDGHCRRKAIVCINKPDVPANVARAARRRMVESAGDIPIVDVSLSTGKTRDEQILAAIQTTCADTIYMTRNDVFYTPWHFAATIHTDDKLVINTNVGSELKGDWESQAIGSRLLLEEVYGQQKTVVQDQFSQQYPNILATDTNTDIPYWLSARHALSTEPVPGQSLWDNSKYAVSASEWDRGAKNAVAFWGRRLRSRAKKRTPTEGPLPECLISLLPPEGDAAILDVGAGPYSTFPEFHDGRRLHITAVDALADATAGTLKRSGLTPKHPSSQVWAEELTAHFPAAHFDIVYCANALDHMRDPILVLQNMATVVKPGGYVVVVAFENEARRSRGGLHNWNINISKDQPYIAPKAGKPINMSTTLGQWAECVSCSVEGTRRPVITTVYQRVLAHRGVA